MSTVIEVLQKRGFIEAMTSVEVAEIVKKPIKVYVGFDPTGESLHLGHLIPLMGLAWFQRFGHTPVALVGGATGMIGDPSGKSQERNLLDQATIEKNVQGIKENLEGVLDRKSALFLNNYDWFKGFSLLEFLRDVGKHFRLGPMLAKESVKTRLHSQEGMSFTEFSYQLLQSYDFLHLFDQHNVVMQMGGSDQWGNITAGVELVRKLRGKGVYGASFPLLTRSDGKKFGKTEEGAIWLSAKKLSPYDFYQYLVRVPDADVGTMMRLLTFMPLEEIQEIERQMKQEGYVPNTAQKRLAAEVTTIIHGEKGLESALRVTQGAAPGTLATTLDAASLENLAKEMPGCCLEEEQVIGRPLIEILVAAGLAPSKSEARRLIRNGGVYLNNEKISDENISLSLSDIIESKWLLLAAGKKNKKLIQLKHKGA